MFYNIQPLKFIITAKNRNFAVMKKIATSNKYIFGIILLLCNWWLFFVHYYKIGFVDIIRSALLDTFLDALFVSLPYFFVPRNWRKSALVITSLFSVIFEVNILYFRNFKNLPGMDSLFAGDAFNYFTIVGAFNSFHVSDLVILLPALTVILAWYLLKGKRICQDRFPARIVVSAIVIFLIAPFARAGMTIRRHYYWSGGTEYIPFREYLSEKLSIARSPQNNLTALNDFGFCVYLWSNLSSAVPRTHKLTSEEIDTIRNYLYSSTTAEICSQNEAKNLIIIIVESLNSSVLGMDAARCLTNLTTLDSSVVAPRLISQIGIGGSSDGQFILNTGLLPLRSEAVISHFARNDYPSIVKSLPGRTSIEIIAEDAGVWNHKITSRSYGYERYIDNVAINRLDCDSILLSKSIEIIDSLPQPFIVEITTIGMHSPYNVPKTSLVIESIKDQKARNYMSAVASFDRALCDFIDRLHQQGLYDNSVIVITGDHPAPASAMSPSLVTNTVPLIILNAGVSVYIDSIVGQIDIFPTIMDIMGVKKRYRGVGVSLLSDTISRQPTEAQTVSELIIRSRSSAEFLEGL